jgi:hypothetical protein
MKRLALKTYDARSLKNHTCAMELSQINPTVGGPGYRNGVNNVGALNHLKIFLL